MSWPSGGHSPSQPGYQAELCRQLPGASQGAEQTRGTGEGSWGRFRWRSWTTYTAQPGAPALPCCPKMFTHIAAPPHQPRPPHPLLYFLSQFSSQVDLSRGQVYTFVVHSHSFPWRHPHPPCPASHPAPHRLPAVTSWGILPTLLQQDPWPVPAGAVRYWTLPTPQALGPQTHAPVLHFLAGFP